MNRVTEHLEKGLHHVVYAIFLFAVGVILFAFFSGKTTQEANAGNFEAQKYNDNWNATVNGESISNVSLPRRFDCEIGDTIVLRKQLSRDVKNGMNLMLKTTIQDVYVYIDGKLREKYAVSNFDKTHYYLPDAYVSVGIDENDAEKEIEIRYIIRETGEIGEITLDYGGNAWFDIISRNSVLTIYASCVFFLGLFATVMFIILRKKAGISKTLCYIGFLMMTVGLWQICESKIRQLLFNRASITLIASILLMEIMGVFALLYFDEVQHKKHHRTYIVLAGILTVQILLDIILDITGFASMYNTIIISHIELVITMSFIALYVIRDIKSGEIERYKITAVGMCLFGACSLFEILNFYFKINTLFGLVLCIGLVLLLATTIIQTLIDVIKNYHSQEQKQQESWIKTIETIASTIDAKDEYTGGHSNRVAEYAAMLAMGMPEEYGFSEENILDIKYIGLMHDIGKIGVADTILNKAGKLTNEEFSLMKKHVEIGSSLLSSMEGNMEGLIEGVRYHHERYDGKGYPDGLKGEKIPLVARVLCLADCYDAMTSNRVYRKRLSDEEVRNEILRCAGTQFDPNLAEIFVRLLDEGKIHPITVEGLETNKEGFIRKSSLLEEKLQKDLSEGKENVLNPSHVRMICYILKLEEYRKNKFEIFLVSLKNGAEDSEKLNSVVKEYVGPRDINVAYTKTQNIVVLFNRSPGEIKAALETMSKETDIVRKIL